MPYIFVSFVWEKNLVKRLKILSISLSGFLTAVYRGGAAPSLNGRPPLQTN